MKFIPKQRSACAKCGEQVVERKRKPCPSCGSMSRVITRTATDDLPVGDKV